MSIGVACNFFQEQWSLHGFLENVTQWADDVVLTWAGPKCESPDDDPSVEIARKWGVKLLFDNIDEGYGAVRTRLLRNMTTDWIMIMDADERFYPTLPIYRCEGTDKYPECQEPKDLRVIVEGQGTAQGLMLRDMLDKAPKEAMALRTSRRHWFDFSFKRPTQNWMIHPDYQLRIVRNDPSIIYTTIPKMHERIIDTRTGREPVHLTHDSLLGPFHDHFHCHFKAMEKEQRAHDIRIYDALDQDKEIPKC